MNVCDLDRRRLVLPNVSRISLTCLIVVGVDERLGARRMLRHCSTRFTRTVRVCASGTLAIHCKYSSSFVRYGHRPWSVRTSYGVFCGLDDTKQLKTRHAGYLYYDCGDSGLGSRDLEPFKGFRCHAGRSDLRGPPGRRSP